MCPSPSTCLAVPSGWELPSVIRSPAGLGPAPEAPVLVQRPLAVPRAGFRGSAVSLAPRLLYHPNGDFRTEALLFLWFLHEKPQAQGG